MGKFSDTRRHASWNFSLNTAKFEPVRQEQGDSAEDFPISRMIVFTAPYGEGGVISRFFANYERKLKFNPGIISDLFESILKVLPQSRYPLPDEDCMEIITSKNWHPEAFGPDANEEAVAPEVRKYLLENEPSVKEKRTLLLRIEGEHCLVFCVLV